MAKSHTNLQRKNAQNLISTASLFWAEQFVSKLTAHSTGISNDPPPRASTQLHLPRTLSLSLETRQFFSYS